MKLNKLLLFEKISNLVSKDSLVICISGRSCSGKTTLSEDIAEHFFYLRPLILCQDSWYKDISGIMRDSQGYPDMEALNAFETEEFKTDVNLLLKNKSTIIPSYNIATNMRKSKKEKVNMYSLLILEGLHTVDIFKDLEKNYAGSVLYVYMDTSFYTCRERRVSRDTSNFMVRDDFVSKFYTSVIEKHYEPYIDLQKNIILQKNQKGVLYHE